MRRRACSNIESCNYHGCVWKYMQARRSLIQDMEELEMQQCGCEGKLPRSVFRMFLDLIRWKRCSQISALEGRVEHWSFALDYLDLVHFSAGWHNFNAITIRRASCEFGSRKAATVTIKYLLHLLKFLLIICYSLCRHATPC